MINKIVILVLLFNYILDASSQDFFAFSKNNDSTKFGVINSKGTEIIENKYRYFHYYNNHLVATDYFTGPSSIYDTTGKLIFSDIWLPFFLSKNKYVILSKYNKFHQSKYAFLSLDGKNITDYIYDYIDFDLYKDYIEDYAIMVKDSVHYFIDTLGNIIFQNKNINIFKDSLNLFFNINVENEKFIAPIIVDYDSPERMSELQGKKNGLIALTNNITITQYPKYDIIKEMCCNNFIVQKDKKYEVIDNKGVIIADIIYDKIIDVSKTTIIVCENKQYGAIDKKTKKIIIPIKYNKLEYIQ